MQVRLKDYLLKLINEPTKPLIHDATLNQPLALTQNTNSEAKLNFSLPNLIISSFFIRPEKKNRKKQSEETKM